MALFDLTPVNKIVPGIVTWSPNPSTDIFGEQFEIHISLLHHVEQEHRMRSINPIDVYDNAFQSDLLKKIAITSWPLRQILTKNVTVPVNPEWLTYWELYYRTIINTLQIKINLRKKASAKLRKNADPASIRTDIKYRSFHIADNTGMSIQAIQKALNRVEYLTGSQITHEFLATYTTDENDLMRAKNPNRWTIGVDGEGRCNVGNMRAWKNKIATVLKAVDIIVSNHSEDTAQIIAFTLINLSLGGTALIYIPKMADGSIVSLIHLFTNCFDTTNIYHMVATDRLYLTGEGFLNNINAKMQKILYEFCESIESTPNMNLFSQNYTNDIEFTNTIDKIYTINQLIYEWRLSYYDKMFKLFDQLNKSMSAKTFDGYIDKTIADLYIDNTAQWITATHFVFIQ